MTTNVAEIADGIYRLSTHNPDLNLTFNQFLIDADEPLLFHTGPRRLFASVSRAVGTILPIERLRWLSFSHLEADECGSMNEFLAAAPRATIAVGRLAVSLSVADMADRAPRPLADREVIDVGGKRVRWIDTPHVPHSWEAGVLFEESTRTLLSSDLFGHVGDPRLVTSGDLVDAALAGEAAIRFTALTPSTAPTIRGLAELAPAAVATMHGAAFRGDGRAALDALAEGYQARFDDAVFGLQSVRG